MKRILECVPNFSEGRDLTKIKQITQVIEEVEGVQLLDVDPGKATHRTVVTIVGDPESVIEAAFQAIRKAAEVIDMTKHQGEHPRMGATDVCPLIPVSGITVEEAVEFAKRLAERVGRELQIPVYLYEYAQPIEARKNLSVIRQGEYEGFFRKIQKPEWEPDFGPKEFPSKSGATVIGVRDFLIAYNVNLNTKSTRLANSVAFDIRENGRVKREGHPITGKIVLDENGEQVRIPGMLPECKAIGWFIDEYQVAQVSINLTKPSVTSVHHAFDACCESAQKRGLRVTGSELVGLIPLQAMLDAGKHYLIKQGRSIGVPDSELIHIAVKSLGLDELAPFHPHEKIIEYKMGLDDGERLVKMTVKGLAYETASESMVPGGGSIAAYAASLGTALGAMCANLSAGKRGWEDKVPFFSSWAEKGQKMLQRFLYLVDEDTRSFAYIIDAFGLPKETQEEKEARSKAIQKATQYAVEVPFETLSLCLDALSLSEAMVENGNPSSVTDAGVGVLMLRAAANGAALNVMVNIRDLKDRTWAEAKLKETEAVLKKVNEKAATLELKVFEVVLK